jgi:hypothetical protein
LDPSLKVDATSLLYLGRRRMLNWQWVLIEEGTKILYTHCFLFALGSIHLFDKKRDDTYTNFGSYIHALVV